MYILTTPRLGLRRLAPSDLTDFHAIWSNQNAINGPFLPPGLRSYAVSHTPAESSVVLAALSPSKANPAPHTYGVFLLAREGGDPMIGVVGVFRSTAGEAGYIFNQAYWGKGYASEALAVFLDIYWQYAEEDLNLPQAVMARVDPENPASVRVLRKCGFVDVERLVREGGKDLLLRAERPVHV